MTKKYDIKAYGVATMTVKEFIEVLKKCPQDYSIGFEGDPNSALAVCEEDKTVCIDDYSWFESENEENGG